MDLRSDDLEVTIERLKKEIDILKTIIDTKDIQIEKLRDQVRQLKQDAEEMLLYP
jgi:predicted RNase H-like nuclease (RuvC/YqgF family)